MKKITLIVLILISFVAVKSYSQIVLDENFSYPSGDSLTAHGWQWINSYVNPPLVASGNLTFSGYPNSGIGNYVRLHNNGQDIYDPHDSVTANSVYYSFLINVDSAQATGDYFAALLPNTSTTTYTARTFIKGSGSGFVVGISKSTEAATYGATVFNFGTTYLMVIKYTFLTGGTTDDEMRLFMVSGAIPGTEPSPLVGPITNTAVNDPLNLSRFALRQGSASNAASLWIDGIRISRVWSNITGVSPVSTIAESFKLSQNYPNPFNPTTNIEFSVPKSSFVTLKVYDVMGREVKSLVNEQLQQGTYKVDFGANNLSSGVYYYRINMTELVSSKSFTDTKSMILVK